jgi:Tfp pilus assembly protein PilV
MRRTRRRELGVSLIEALVAFGVMAFGMMAVVGMQATLRGNGDLARQRAEAVRIAQDYIEEWRGFSTLVTTTNRTAYADIATPSGDTTEARTNAIYTVKRQVNAEPVVSGTVPAQRRTLVVEVAWVDRAGQDQSVKMATSIVGIEPELNASVVLAANPDQVLSPLSRNRGIPPGAVALPGGRSGFVPPGQTGGDTRVAWVFNNTTGVITICTTTGTSTGDLLTTLGAPICGSQKALLLSGGVRFATGTSAAPTAASVTNPAGPDYPAFGVSVTQTSPVSQSVGCFQDAVVDTQVLYFCAVPITSSVLNWSGSVLFGTPLPIASALSVALSSQYKVCRYQAPASYTAVAVPTVNQNFVIIKAGDNTTFYECPTTGTPRTWAHQPTT